MPLEKSCNQWRNNLCLSLRSGNMPVLGKDLPFIALKTLLFQCFCIFHIQISIYFIYMYLYIKLKYICTNKVYTMYFIYQVKIYILYIYIFKSYIYFSIYQIKYIRLNKYIHCVFFSPLDAPQYLSKWHIISFRFFFQSRELGSNP